ncbi:hypothetical protein Tco_1030726 [Tanacetum coccineum]|uniref:CCHC-type domain-containing protein n=1 Tax=Tanacetum coccineum TaxID=301880 RepID=A0ABQ5G7I9_9ASTR
MRHAAEYNIGVLLRNGYTKNEQKRCQNGQNRAQDWKEREKLKPKINSSTCLGFQGARGVGVVRFNAPTLRFDLFHGYWVVEDPLEDALRNGNSSIDAPNPNSFNDPPNVFTHPPQPQNESYSCELCGNDAHYGYDCPLRVPLVYEHEPGYDNFYPQNSPSFPQQYLNCEKCGGPHEDYQCQPWHQNYSELNPCYDSNSYGFDQPTQYSIDHQPQSIQEDLNQQRMNDVLKAVQSLVEKLCQQEQATNLSTHTPEPSRHFNSICYDDDDDEESTIPLNEIISQIPLSNAITPVLPTMEPEDSLSMGDEHLSTIPEKESDEFIKSSVEDLVPIPSESEDTPGSDSECNDFSPINILEGKSVTFSNPLFDSNDDFTSSDDESLSDEDVLEDNVKIYSNPLFEFDDEYISSDENPLQFISRQGDILLLDKLLNDDPSSPLPPKELKFEELKDTILNLPPKVFLDRNSRNLEDEPDKDDLESMVKVFDPGIHKEIISLTYDCPDYEDSRARGFVHRSLELLSLACLYMGIQYPRSY